MKTMHYAGTPVVITKAQYRNGRIALEMTNADTGEYHTTVTVNIPEIELLADEIIVKDYSENQGMLQFLVTNGITSEPVKFVHSDFVIMPVCKLLTVPQ